MSPEQQQQQQQPTRTLSSDALRSLYAELGARAHEVYELQAQNAALAAELERAKALLREAMERYGPPSGDGAAPEEPAPLAARQEGAG